MPVATSEAISMPTFNVLNDPRPDDYSIPAFMVSTTRGFLPRQDPVVKLPPEFDPLESILSRMPIYKADVTLGLLATGSLGPAIKSGELPNLASQIEKYKDNLPLMNALYRDYSFLASAYLLEPCHLKWRSTRTHCPEDEVQQDGEYGLGRDVLPSCISVPIAKVAKLTGFQPFMEYAGSYALYNYKLIDPSKPLEYNNLSLIRAFEHGLDPKSSEAGFVLVHIDMVKESGPLVAGAMNILKGARGNDGKLLEGGLHEVRLALKKVNKVMENMWRKSKPADYNSFRTFIFGITSQSMFPKGVLYEGVSDERLFFRGESGANDSMIPLCDNLLQIPMPTTPLTGILQDFRQYRPGNHREFLEWVKKEAEDVGIRYWCLDVFKTNAVTTGSQRVLELYLFCLDQVREFRWRHWCFTREYIIKKSPHPTATGGSPIVTWLPNQLNAVLELAQDVLNTIDKINLPVIEKAEVERVREIVRKQKEQLDKEVAKYCAERNVQDALNYKAAKEVEGRSVSCSA